MSLKCSLFGHRYGDTEVRRDREQDGSELVETVTEVKVCQRCGESLVISESTEVRTVETADDAGGPAGAGGGRDTPADRAGGTPGTTAPADGGTSTDRPATQAESGGADRPGVGAESDPRGADTAATDPGPGSDPVTDSPGPAEDSAERDMPPARKDDAIIIDENGEEQPGAEWPQEDSEDDEDVWEPDTELDTDSDAPGEPSSGPSGGLTVPEGEFHCSECGFTTAVESSSLRAGDFCPECHRGALEHYSN